MLMEGKTAIVTGGGTGVGRATALELARRGAVGVAINYSRSKDDAERTAAEVRELGAQALAVRADVADDADCRSFVAEAVSAFGRLDLLVNNAGTTVFVPHDRLDDVSAEDFTRLYSVNTVGPFQMARAALEHLAADGGGEVVNVSSIAGVAAIGSSIPYCASKAALNNLTVALARVMAPNVRVNAVAPGFITGRWLRGGYGDEGYDRLRENAERQAPLGAVCEPEDVTAAILGLVEGSDLVTGQVLVVDGGMLIRR